MSKKLKILTAALVVALLLTVGVTVTVMADEEPAPSPEAEKLGLLERVAEILEIDQEDLIEAFNQARQELRGQIRQKHQERKGEAFNRLLEKAIEEGYITEEEVEEIKDWWTQKPTGAMKEWLEQKPKDEIREWLEQKPVGKFKERLQEKSEAVKPNALRRILTAQRGQQMIAVPKARGRLSPSLKGK